MVRGGGAPQPLDRASSRAGRSRCCGRKSKTSACATARCRPVLSIRRRFLLSLAKLETASRWQGRRMPNAACAAERCLEDGNWEVTEHDENVGHVSPRLPELKLEIIKRYTLEPVPPGSRDDENYPGYHLQLDVEVRNTGDAPQVGRLSPRRPDRPAARRLVVRPQDQPDAGWCGGTARRGRAVPGQRRAADRLLGDRQGQGRADGPGRSRWPTSASTACTSRRS